MTGMNGAKLRDIWDRGMGILPMASPTAKMAVPLSRQT